MSPVSAPSAPSVNVLVDPDNVWIVVDPLTVNVPKFACCIPVVAPPLPSVNCPEPANVPTVVAPALNVPNVAVVALVPPLTVKVPVVVPDVPTFILGVSIPVFFIFVRVPTSIWYTELLVLLNFTLSYSFMVPLLSTLNNKAPVPLDALSATSVTLRVAAPEALPAWPTLKLPGVLKLFCVILICEFKSWVCPAVTLNCDAFKLVKLLPSAVILGTFNSPSLGLNISLALCMVLLVADTSVNTFNSFS